MGIETKSIELDADRVLTFRPVGPADEPFLLAVYASTREEELALTGWTDQQRNAFLKMQFDAQHVHYRGQYPAARYLIIQLNQNPVGRIYIAETDDEIRVLDVTVLPEYRGGGIGTAIIRQLMQTAAAAGKPLGIYVETYNRSLGLFERLGFVRSGEAGYSFLMLWSPVTASQTAAP